MDSSLTYATTPLALASLAIIAGVGILKLLVSGRNNAVSKLITHYGFIVVIAFGILGNVSYLYSQSLSKELLVFGNVVEAGTGTALGRVVIDAGPHSRGMSGDSGDFFLAIPASRQQENYDLHAVLPGYERAASRIKSGPRMFVTMEMKKSTASNVLQFGEADIIIGHYLGLPEIYLPLVALNSRLSSLVLRNFSLRATAPSGNTRQLFVGTTSPSMAGPYGPPLAQVQVKGQDTASWVNGFMQQDQQVQSLSVRAYRALQSSPLFQVNGPRVGATYLSPEMNTELASAMDQNWFWEPGVSLLKLVCTDDNGHRYELNGAITVSNQQIQSMRQISKYYNAGYGVLTGTQLMPVGSAQPSQQVNLSRK
jgi:hypothetical protein